MTVLKNVELSDELIDYFSKRGIRTTTGVVRKKHIKSYNRFQKFLPLIGEEAISMPILIFNEFFFQVTQNQSSLADVLIEQGVLDELFCLVDEEVDLEFLMSEWSREYGLVVYQKASVEEIKSFLLKHDVIKLKTSSTIFTDSVLKSLAHLGIRTLSEGKIDEDRTETYERFERIYPFIEDLEEEIGAHELVKKCAFTPKKSVASLVDILVSMEFLDEYFLPINSRNIDIDDIYHDWKTETGYIPYERVSKDLIISFLSERGIGDENNFDQIDKLMEISERRSPGANEYFGNSDDY